MTQTANPQSKPWDFDFRQPLPHQDSDLLENLHFIPGLKELLMLRQVHALEHATVWMLSAKSGNENHYDNETLGGLSTEQGFYLYGEVSRYDLQRAVKLALQRLKHGEWNLAVHPRCGTNLSVNMLLTAGLAFGVHLLLPRGLITQTIGLGLAAATAAQLTPDLGSWTQKYITTSIPFNLEVEGITQKSDSWGRGAQFVQVRWKSV